jgi:hypothetical protein
VARHDAVHVHLGIRRLIVNLGDDRVSLGLGGVGIVEPDLLGERLAGCVVDLGGLVVGGTVLAREVIIIEGRGGLQVCRASGQSGNDLLMQVRPGSFELGELGSLLRCEILDLFGRRELGELGDVAVGPPRRGIVR